MGDVSDYLIGINAVGVHEGSIWFVHRSDEERESLTRTGKRSEWFYNQRFRLITKNMVRRFDFYLLDVE